MGTEGIPSKVKSAGLAALIMLGLSFPIVAYHADMDLTRGLFLESRWPLVALLVGGVFILRLLGEIVLSWMHGRRAAAETPKTKYGVSPNALRLIGFAGIGALIAFPLAAVFTLGPAGSLKWIDNYGIQILIYVMLGWGLNIVVGLAGLLDLGYVAFYAVGAYAYALLATDLGWSFWLCLPICGAIAALFGIALGFPVLRLRGDYLAIVTLAFGEITRVVAVNWTALTNGDAGVSLIPKITFLGIPFTKGEAGFAAHFGLPFFPIERTIFLYYLILALALLTNFLTTRLRRLPLGRVWEALREDEIACRSLGIDTVKAKLSAFAIGALIAGIAGAFFAVRQGFVSPSSFGFIESATILSIVVLGGAGSQLGIVLAAILIIGGSEFLRELDVLQEFFGYTFDPTQYRMLLVGLAMVAMMNWRPRGLVSVRRPSIFLKKAKPVAVELIAEGRT
ncbi:high-affinity branched-chain amino acid ABC transporter permease LivM [Methyloferula stellata]|uniref:high-affinity branched-chain amino acid ABC transporter permease LivM n=1 Tax=Methyloferula stellata TaxID=876270 RepID=UPI00036CC508|nr:high-affinity branched-chain amino acid ABC transporter permease LivM [Methyloferula stellata]